MLPKVSSNPVANALRELADEIDGGWHDHARGLGYVIEYEHGGIETRHVGDGSLRLFGIAAEKIDNEEKRAA